MLVGWVLLITEFASGSLFDLFVSGVLFGCVFTDSYLGLFYVLFKSFYWVVYFALRRLLLSVVYFGCLVAELALVQVFALFDLFSVGFGLY